MRASAQPFATEQERWRAVVERDRRADECFVYAVTTTGVFCRPACGARRPRRDHVRFHDTAEGARGAGFRPCRRCRPEGRLLSALWLAAVAKACRTIEASDARPSNAALAAEAGMSSSHFQRVFKHVTGLTPVAYAAQVRTARLQSKLKESSSVTEAIYDSGFGSSSRFYSGSAGALGMSPSGYRKGGAGIEIRYAVASCSLGWILVAATQAGVCAILLGDDHGALAVQLRSRFPEAVLVEGDEPFDGWVALAVEGVETPRAGMDLPLDIRGTAFQQLVWQALRRIPAGSTATYSQIANEIGRPAAARAVAAACAANPVAVVVPCHRVVRADGSLGGYRWGIERKEELLRREGAPG